MKTSLRIFNYAALSCLLLLSGCGCKKDEQAGTATVGASAQEEILVTMNGKPALTLKEFQGFMQEATSADQQMQLMAQLMPDFEEQVFDRAKVREIVISEWAKRTNASHDEEYRKQKEQAKKFPAVLGVIKANDKEFWVVKVFGHQTAKYHNFDQVKENIKETLKARKTEEVIEKKLAELQKEYNIVVNKTYFERKKQERAEKQALAAKEQPKKA